MTSFRIYFENKYIFFVENEMYLVTQDTFSYVHNILYTKVND